MKSRLEEGRQRQRPEERRRPLLIERPGERLRSFVGLGKPRRPVALDRGQRCEQRHEHRVLALVSLSRRRQRRHELQATRQQTHRLAAGVGALSVDGGPLVPRDGVGDRPGAVVVGGELGAHRAGVAGVQRGEGGRHGEVVAPSAHRALAEVGDLAQLVVAEVVGIGAALGDDAPPPQLVQGGHQHVLTDVGGPGQQLGREGEADRRRDVGELAGRPREQSETGLDDGLHHRGDRAWSRLVAGPSGAQRLDDEQRVAGGLGVQPGASVFGERATEGTGGEVAGLDGCEPAELDLIDSIEPGEPSDQLGEHVVGLLAAGRRHDQQRRVRGAAQQVVEELQAVRVGPLDVVGDEQQRLGRYDERGGDSGEQLRPVVAVVSRRLDRQIWQQPGEVASVPRVEPLDALGERPQPGDGEPVGEGAFGAVGARLGDGGATAGAPRRELLDEAGLAHPWLSRHQHQPGLAPLGGAPLGGESGLLIETSHQGRRADPPDLVVREGRGRQQGVVGGPSRRRRFDAQLAFEHRRAQRGRCATPGPGHRAEHVPASAAGSSPRAADRPARGARSRSPLRSAGRVARAARRGGRAR